MRRTFTQVSAAFLVASAVSPMVADARVRVGIGVGFGPYFGAPGYYYPHPYYYAPYAYAPEYYYPESPPVAYGAPVAPQQVSAEYWYYCPPARAYYPYIRQCPSGWQAVSVQQGAHQSTAPVSTTAPEGKKTYSLGDVLFDSGQSELLPAATSVLDALVAAAKKSPDREIKIEGYTDSYGDESYNRELSRRRADAVRQYLVAHGISPSRIETLGRGDAAPVASNATAEGRRQNRRVDVILG